MNERFTDIRTSNTSLECVVVTAALVTADPPGGQTT